MKRLLIVLLVLSLLLILPTAQADAAPMRKLKLEATVSEDVLDVRIYADVNYADGTVFESIDFGLSYAQDILELIESVKTGEALESDILDGTFYYQENTNETGHYRLSAFSVTGNAASGLLVHLRFRIIGEGYYGFRLIRDLAQYSVYNPATGTQTSYDLPRLDIDVEVTSTAIPDLQEDQKESTSILPTETKTEETKENGFLRFLRSIFGTSCFGG